MTDADPSSREPRGIQSIEVGGQLLLALAHHGRPMALKDLARDAGMTPAKAHPYLVSFIKLGLVEQDGGAGRAGLYGLGPLAMQLGLISLQQYDPVRLATPVIEELALRLGHTVAIAVWGTQGPTIVRVAEGPTPVHISMRHGTVMSLAGTASGRLFAAWREVEAAALHQPLPAAEALADIRAQGCATSRDSVVAGVSAAAAPVFDASRRLVLSLTAIGASAGFDTALDGAPVLALREAAVGLSRRLGGAA
ncbi:helix-turn-helix domain-containing protein [Pelomonas sp. UHG3]|uniref:Helix-turn-helix domain-containing protein n=1 Tax=Roseateles hydrophilus TaxID=2975054 RepID=A0ACC6CDC5_9BURK|nr:helix-turn-helix domain-containing protein [Pelomonas sp. UHG3]MCY4746436.1 helix-turn-helix domain-containing protein [Pelomonas sp. UHG3]